MKQLYLIFERDTHHSRSTETLMGVFDDFDLAVEASLKEMKKNKVFPKNEADNARRMLKGLHQTQGYDTNYAIEAVTINKFAEI